MVMRRLDPKGVREIDVPRSNATPRRSSGTTSPEFEYAFPDRPSVCSLVPMTKKLALAAVLLSGCAADVEPTVEGHWTVTADVSPCLADPVAIDFTVEGDEVTVADPIAGDAIELTEWDEFKFALTIITSGGAQWVIQVDPETDAARIWYSDGDCSVGAVPAISVEHE